MFGIEFHTKKSANAYVYLPPKNGAREHKRLIWLKYNTVMKRQNTFNLGLYAAKNMCHIKKKIQIKVVRN